MYVHTINLYKKFNTHFKSFFYIYLIKTVISKKNTHTFQSIPTIHNRFTR